MINSSNEYVVITGANSGIGKALAEKFAENNHNLLLISRKLNNIEHLASERIICIAADVADWEKIAYAFSEADERLGTINGLINNAGFLDADAISVPNSLAWKKMIDSNLLGATNTIQLASQRMISQQFGTIINVGSVAGKETFPNIAMYCAVKHGLHGLSSAVRKELAPHNVRVMTAAPGFTETQLYENISNPTIKNSIDQWANSLGKLLSPSEIADFIYHLYTLPQHINIQEVVITPTTQV